MSQEKTTTKATAKTSASSKNNKTKKTDANQNEFPVKNIHEIMDFLVSDPLIKRYSDDLIGNDSYRLPYVLELTLYNLIKDTDTFFFELLDRNFSRIKSKSERKHISRIVLQFTKHYKFLDKTLKKLNSERATTGFEVLERWNNYFGGKESQIKRDNTLLYWKGAGKHFAQLLLVLREHGWIEFPDPKSKLNPESFSANLFSFVRLEKTDTAAMARYLRTDGAYREKTPEKTSDFKKIYRKTFAGKHFFSLIEKYGQGGVKTNED